MSAITLDAARGPMLGTRGGECFRAFCSHTGANWHHAKADRYYCEACAAQINREAQLKGEPPACTRHS